MSIRWGVGHPPEVVAFGYVDRIKALGRPIKLILGGDSPGYQARRSGSRVGRSSRWVPLPGDQYL